MGQKLRTANSKATGGKVGVWGVGFGSTRFTEKRANAPSFSYGDGSDLRLQSPTNDILRGTGKVFNLFKNLAVERRSTEP
jgi:hypothetical protein